MPRLGPPHWGRFHSVARSSDQRQIIAPGFDNNCAKATKVELYRHRPDHAVSRKVAHAIHRKDHQFVTRIVISGLAAIRPFRLADRLYGKRTGAAGCNAGGRHDAGQADRGATCAVEQDATPGGAVRATHHRI